MYSSMDFLFILPSALALSLLLLISTVESQKHSVAIDLFRGDSPGSLSYDLSLTPSDRVRRSIARSKKRIEWFTKGHLRSTAVSQQQKFDNSLYPDMGMDGFIIFNMSLGTPPQTISLLFDTGSDLIWTQCKKCKPCYPQNAPLYNLDASSTNKRVSGSDKVCNSGNQFKPSWVRVPGTGIIPRLFYGCVYDYGYGDGSTTYGVVSRDKVTFISANGSKTSFPNITYGCGTQNQGTFGPDMTGILGAGGGPLSFTSQSGIAVFSYCLNLNGNPKPGKLNYGPNPNATQSGTLTLPLRNEQTYYAVTLLSISVGLTKISTTVNTQELLIDSGTTFTLLGDPTYTAVYNAITAAIPDKPVQNSLDLTCYPATAKINVTVTLNFNEGSLAFTQDKVFLPMTDDENGNKLLCLIIVSSGNGGLGILGNVFQGNILIQYTQKVSVSFLPTNCEQL